MVLPLYEKKLSSVLLNREERAIFSILLITYAKGIKWQTPFRNPSYFDIFCNYIFFHFNDYPFQETVVSDFQIVCLRLSRVNHACVPNSAHWYDDDYRVKILFSEKPIKAGEEITYSYVTLRSLHHSYTPAIIRTTLQLTWGIFCPEGLFWFLTK
jgi:SET domain